MNYSYVMLCSVQLKICETVFFVLFVDQVISFWEMKNIQVKSDKIIAN